MCLTEERFTYRRGAESVMVQDTFVVLSFNPSLDKRAEPGKQH